MRSLDYKRNNEDPCLYVKRQPNGHLIMLILYVDDMLIAGHSKKDNVDLKTKLKSKFDMKDLGEANHILGMCITRDRNKTLLYLSQKEYVHKVLIVSTCKRQRHVEQEDPWEKNWPKVREGPLQQSLEARPHDGTSKERPEPRI
ncbi:hypothetical protein L7F22_030405 [Adiantum nelumboides]|nr:hypothetical protein [Adiantum nelumboides]